MEKNYEQIELRSEKVRNIIGRIPPLLIRSGITLIALLITALAAATCFIPYPENVKGKVDVTINDNSEIEIITFIPYTEIARIKEDMPVSIEMEGYNARTYGHLNGKVKTIHKEVSKKEGKNYFRADLKLDNAVDYHIMKKGMEGTATILVSDRSLAQYLLPTYLRKQDKFPSNPS